MKKHLLLALAAIVLCFVACNKEADEPTPTPSEPVAVTGVSLNKTMVVLEIGESVTVEAIVTPETAVNKEVKWSIANTAIATVTDGVVTAVAEGETELTVTTDDGGHTATIPVVVTEKVAVTGVSLNKTMVALEIGESVTVEATVTPETADNKEVKWSIANTAIATVSNGVVTGVAAGETELTVTTDDGGHTATIPVKVVTEKVAVTGIQWINAPSKGYQIGSGSVTQTFVLKISPNNATDLGVTFTSSDTNVMTINSVTYSQNFILVDFYAVGGGEATITATTNDGGFTATTETMTVIQVVLVESIAVNPSTCEIKVGSNKQLTATVSPSSAFNKEVEWSSSDTSVATVDANGLVTGVASGEVTITVKAKDASGVTGTAKVTVSTGLVESIAVDPSTCEIEVGSNKRLKATVLPNDADNKAIEWISSDTSVATVDANGLVTGVAKGEVTITATAKDGSGVTGTAKVTVTVPITALTFDGQTDAKFVTWHGNEFDLKAAADGDLKTLKWAFTPDKNTEYTEVISSDKATITAWSNKNTTQSVVNVSVGKQTGGLLAHASVTFRTTAYMYKNSGYTNSAAWWFDENNYSYTITTAREKYYFVAYCAPLSHSATDDPEMYFPDSYIPTSAYTLTTNNDKVTVKKLNDKCYEITDSDLSTYKELVLTYTCGKQTFTYTTKIVPR